jgi:regulator of replication initiation timing
MDHTEILITVLQEQLHAKDTQIMQINTHIENLLERNRELNVLLHNFQNQLKGIQGQKQETIHEEFERQVHVDEEFTETKKQSDKTGHSTIADEDLYTIPKGVEARKFEDWLSMMR